ncbi:UNVERIFIED_CONTAM: hypothetical protein K2H54_073220 [Gekko kuhli]
MSGPAPFAAVVVEFRTDKRTYFFSQEECGICSRMFSVRRETGFRGHFLVCAAGLLLALVFSSAAVMVLVPCLALGASQVPADSSLWDTHVTMTFGFWVGHHVGQEQQNGV